MTLRHYQTDAIGRVQAAYREGARSVCLCMATGAGKSHAAIGGVIVPSVARSRRVMFVAHLEEIIDDAAGRIASAGLSIGIVKAGRRADAAASVQVCSMRPGAPRRG